MFNPSREQARRFFCEAWRKRRERLVLEGEEILAADVIEEHPEYHALLENLPMALEQEYPPDGGRENPFLHLALHLAVAEQTGIDQPPGIKAAYFALGKRLATHEAKHRIMLCLAEALWDAQHDGSAMDNEAYLKCIRREAGRALRSR